MASQLARKLSDGVTAKLDYDYSCNRGHSFGEYHMHASINEIVSSNIDPRILVPHANFPHPALNVSRPAGSGRKREVDFHIKPRTENTSSTSIEAKWAGSSHATARTVLLDLCRLSLIKSHDRTTECLFVLAGKTALIAKLLGEWPLAPQSPQGSRILDRPRPTQNPKERSYEMTGLQGDTKTLELLTERLPEIPDRIRTKLVPPSASTSPRWQTLIWRIY
jgi:hypothetical protein